MTPTALLCLLCVVVVSAVRGEAQDDAQGGRGWLENLLPIFGKPGGRPGGDHPPSTTPPPPPYTGTAPPSTTPTTYTTTSPTTTSAPSTTRPEATTEHPAEQGQGGCCDSGEVAPCCDCGDANTDSTAPYSEGNDGCAECAEENVTSNAEIFDGMDWQDVFGPSNQQEVEAALRE